MAKTPREKFHQEIWYVLQKIEEESLAAGEGKTFFYEVRSVIARGAISKDRQRQIIRNKLHREEKAVKILREIKPDWRVVGGRSGFYLKTLPKFSKVYEKYRKLCDVQTYLNAYQEKTLQNIKEGNGSSNVPEFSQAEPPLNNKIKLDLPTLISNLQRRYDSFVALPEKGFFSGIADYVKYLDESKEFEPVMKLIKKKQVEDEKKVAGLERELKKDIKKTASKVFGLIIKKNIKFDELQQAIDKYNGIIKGRIQSSATREEALYAALNQVIATLFKHDYEKLVKPLIKVDKDGKHILGYNISPIYGSYENELEHFRELRERTIWGSWDNFVLVYLVIHKFREQLKQLDLHKDFWKRMNFIGLHGEMEEILNEKRGDRMHFKQDAYLIYASRVHNFIIDRLFTPSLRMQEQAFGQETTSKVVKSQPGLIESISIPRAKSITKDFVKPYEASLKQFANLSNKFELDTSAMETDLRRVAEEKAELAKSLQPVAELIKQFVEQIKQIKQPETAGSYIGGDIKRKAKKQAEEAEIRRLLLEKLKKEVVFEVNSGRQEPSYNPDLSEITFLGKTIPIPPNTDQDDLCRVILQDGKSMSKIWHCDKMLEKWGGNYEGKTRWRKVYSAGREVNQKVAAKTTIEDLLIVKTKTITVNPEYLQ